MKEEIYICRLSSPLLTNYILKKDLISLRYVPKLIDPFLSSKKNKPPFSNTPLCNIFPILTVYMPQSRSYFHTLLLKI